MKDKFGRTYTKATLQDGRIRLTVPGFMIAIADTQDDALRIVESQPPSAELYLTPTVLRGRSIQSFAGVIEYDFENSTVGEDAELKLVCSISDAKEYFTQEIFKAYTKRMKEIFDLYPRHESDGWAIKRMQSAMWLALDSAGKAAAIASYSSPLCQYRMLIAESYPTVDFAENPELVLASGIDELATKVFTNGAIFEQYYGEVTGYKTQLIRDLNECETAEDFLGLDIEFSAIKTLQERV